MQDKEKLEALIEIKSQIDSPAFQKFIVKPFETRMKGLKGAYDCETLKQLHTIRGEKKGLLFLFKVLKEINTDYENEIFEDEKK